MLLQIRWRELMQKCRAFLSGCRNYRKCHRRFCSGVNVNNSPFSMGWILAMFDLPVVTKKERKVATRFRNDLLDEGFLMIQFSVYARPCVNFEQLTKHIGIVRKLVPE